jgi:tetratricopeptide (TPR) repeat protein
MSNSHNGKDDLSRMWQEAELYEAQGLYDHAVLVYQSVLAGEPQNRKARAKIVHIQFLKKMEETTASRGSLADDLSPRLALDLGVAYMGMNLYDEALEEFRKALATSPAFHADLFRYSATCLIRLERVDETRGLWDQILADRTLTLSEKGGIISDIVSAFVEQGFAILAHNLLSRVSEDQKHFIENYDQILGALSSIDDDVSGSQAPVEDVETGKIYSEPLAEDSTTGEDEVEVRRPSGPPPKEPTTEISLKAPVSYSVDNKNWKEGTSSRLSYGWVLLDLPERVAPGDSLALQIHLPSQESKEPVWVISRVSESAAGQDDEASRVKAQFVSFLPGGEVALKTFVDRALQDPSVTDQGDAFSTSVFAELELDAVRSMEADLLPELSRETALLSTEDHSEVIDAIPPLDRQAPRIKFACECGHIHVLPRRYAGREGKCAKCGKVIKVPDADTRPDSLSDQLIGQTVGGCRLFYKIGGGGMGGVFKGRHIALDIPVAVKVLHAHLADKDPIFVKRFIREARSAAKMQHPNVVGVMNVGLEDGRHYLVMPYVGGGNAASMLAKLGRFPVDKVLSVAFDIARALSVAEENNILHRDIKPANILFTKKGEATLADLGLAKNYLDSQDSGITQTGIACGTPLYFSPEQAKGARNLDIRSDFYSLGITLYHLLNGSPPFHGESAYVIFQKHVHEPLPPFKPTDPPIPDSVFKLLQKMTAKKPEDRFANTTELIEALEKLRDELRTPDKTTKKGWLEKLGLKRAR